MSYKNDSLLVIANSYGKASAEAKVQLFETYDKLRDITVSGTNSSGSGFGTAGGFLMNIARLIAPSSFMTVLNGGQMTNIAGTSYYSAISGGNSITKGANSAFGTGYIGDQAGFPSGDACSIDSNSAYPGVTTGSAASMVSTGLDAATYAAGALSGYSDVSGNGGGNSGGILLPAAGVIAGIGGILQAAGPYLGGFGLGSTVIGNLLQGTGSAALASYSHATNNILNNADSILSCKVANIETVVKMLDAQSEIIRKMLKDQTDSDSKLAQNM